MTTMPQTPPPQVDELREFMMILRQALSMLVAWIERRYHLRRECPHCGGAVNKY